MVEGLTCFIVDISKILEEASFNSWLFCFLPACRRFPVGVFSRPPARLDYSTKVRGVKPISGGLGDAHLTGCICICKYNRCKQ